MKYILHGPYETCQVQKIHLFSKLNFFDGKFDARFHCILAEGLNEHVKWTSWAPSAADWIYKINITVQKTQTFGPDQISLPLT